MAHLSGGSATMANSEPEVSSTTTAFPVLSMESQTAPSGTNAITLWVKKEVNGIPGFNKIRIKVDKCGVVYDLIENALPLISKEVLPEQVFVTVNGKTMPNEEQLSTIGIELLKDKSTNICICWNDTKQQESEGENQKVGTPGSDTSFLQFIQFQGGHNNINATEDLPYFDEICESNIAAFKTIEDVERDLKSVYLIIQTCSKAELHASLAEMNSEVIPVAHASTGMKLYLGTFAHCPCAVICTCEGAKCKDDIKEILEHCSNAQLIIGIGVATGFGTANFGDVLVATEIEHYDEARVEECAIQCRGQRIEITRIIERYFALPDASPWNFQCSKNGRQSKLITGLIASGPYLVESKKWAEGIVAKNAEAKGLEREGYILQEIAEKKSNLDVIIIKGVSILDGFKDAKSEKWQYTAARAAANYANTRLKTYKIQCHAND